ncbi:3-hydroxyacyl-CoA dehydrogenase family protein [Sulfitobacter sp. M368]|uniref:3-hydroxyacyl-CoA dehydrogenase family protein n=1 Tax=Sulfitobacter sp. M368 TaxID=2867021 RepID=UPI0021A3DCDB|nr:3-hydroxyacyl-CoA dehydrogenase family protein [Sulfitobacter sp. M368]UWR15826.1 hypothetical protein K3754_02670 [Sulfitobacter sp. M368]
MTARDAAAVLQDAFWQAGEALMYLHTTPWELDEALTDWGYTMGPCEAQDLIGLEKILAREPNRPVPILPRMVAEGRIGKSGGVGYYRYPGGGGAVIDPLIEDMFREEAWFAGDVRSEISDAQIVETMNAALVQALDRLSLPDAEALSVLVRAVHFPKDKILGELTQRT